MGHVNPNLVHFFGKWLKSPQNTNHWVLSLHFLAMIFICYKDPKSLKSIQFGAVGGQIWSLSGEK